MTEMCLYDIRVTVERIRWGFTEAGGYNRTWGLSLPQRPALAAGSVVLLRAQQELPLDLLLAVEHEGLGERRIDGFGRSRIRASNEAARGKPAADPSPAQRRLSAAAT